MISETFQIEILLIGGPCSGQRMKVDELHENQVILFFDRNELVGYERDGESKNYYHSATKTAILNERKQEFLRKHGHLIKVVRFIPPATKLEESHGGNAKGA